MIVCKQGYGHFNIGLNNQDRYLVKENFKIITDGCSQCKYSEIGNGLFLQALSFEENLNHENFEVVVEKIFDKILLSARHIFGRKFNIEEYVYENLLFTIIAVFELEEKFIVKVLGDGYILSINTESILSYIRLKYGKEPPYFGYNYCESLKKAKPLKYGKGLKFKTFEFLKKEFKSVGIASDGILPFVDGKVSNKFEKYFFRGVNCSDVLEQIIASNKEEFFDDITAILGE